MAKNNYNGDYFEMKLKIYELPNAFLIGSSLALAFVINLFNEFKVPGFDLLSYHAIILIGILSSIIYYLLKGMLNNAWKIETESGLLKRIFFNILGYILLLYWGLLAQSVLDFDSIRIFKLLLVIFVSILAIFLIRFGIKKWNSAK